jgi:butyryl-CoA dehydrogenase
MLRPTIDFLLHDWLRVDALLDRPHFADHSRETFAQVMDTANASRARSASPFNRWSTPRSRASMARK